MGLDIIAYSNLKLIGKCDLDWDTCDENLHIRAWINPSFPRSVRGLNISFVDQNSQSVCYLKTDETQKHAFRAGSYGGYNWWRSVLEQNFNPDCDPAEPFYELINFSDCEGCIGFLAASDLFEDFLIYDSIADTLDTDDLGNFYGRYQEWTKACQLARSEGLIYFC